MKFRNNKGVTLLILSVTIMLLIIVTTITVEYTNKYLNLKNINEMYTDIEAIDVAISDYYLKNEEIPLLSNEYVQDKEELTKFFIQKNGESGWINPDDSGPYYVINLSKLENLTLINGREYKNWKADSTREEYQDLYIINKVTHQIYYPQGMTIDGNTYYTNIK